MSAFQHHALSPEDGNHDLKLFAFHPVFGRVTVMLEVMATVITMMEVLLFPRRVTLL